MILNHRHCHAAASSQQQAHSHDPNNLTSSTSTRRSSRRIKRSSSSGLKKKVASFWIRRTSMNNHAFDGVLVLKIVVFLILGFIVFYHDQRRMLLQDQQQQQQQGGWQASWRWKPTPPRKLLRAADDYRRDRKARDAPVRDVEEKGEEAFPSQYADRHIRKLMEIANDPDCANPMVDGRSVNNNNDEDDFDVEAAAEIFYKCRLLVIKGAYHVDYLKKFRRDFTHFITGLRSGRITTTGTTTTGDSMFFAPRERLRWEIILPESLADPTLVTNPKFLRVLQHPKVLNADMGLRSLQSIVSEGAHNRHHEGGAPGQSWHYDQGFLFDNDNALEEHGIAGHDLPPYTVTVGVPMMNMKRDQGPTEFCMGSSAVSGIPIDPGSVIKVKDESLIAPGSLWDEYTKFGSVSCPAELWRSPLLEFGDVVLFDYNIRHRGGWNTSPDFRAVLLLVYARRWYDDVNFGDTVRNIKHPMEQYIEEASNVLSRTRLAIPDESEPFVEKKKHNNNEEEEDVLLQHVSNFQPEEELFDFETNHEKMEFFASNIDVDFDENNANPMSSSTSNSNKKNIPTLYLNSRKVGPLPPGANRKVKASFGDVMELRSPVTGEVAGRWNLQLFGQVIFSKDTATSIV